MVNWKKVFEQDPIFNIIMRKLADEHMTKDIKIQLEISNILKDGTIRFRPGHEWYFTYNKRLFRSPKLKWKYRFKRPKMTTLMGGFHQTWIIRTSVLCKVFINEFGKHKDEIVIMYWY